MAIFNKTFIIIPEADITTEMINWSTSKEVSEMPEKNGSRLLECSTSPPRDVFSGYTWYHQDNIKGAWDNL